MNKDNISQLEEKAPEELELFHDKKAVKVLVFKIEQSDARVHTRKLELQKLKNSANGAEDPQCTELMLKLDGLKQVLSKLTIGVSSALDSKVKAEKEIEFYNNKASSSLKKVEALRKEIEEVNEEHVLVELARIEAEKELREIELQRAAEAMEFSKKMEAAKKSISELRREISRAKELEEKLAATNTDVSVLQHEMELLRAMEKNSPKELLVENAKKSSDVEQLKIVENELGKAKKQLVNIKEEGFQFMASMDLVRAELLQLSKETNRMKKLEENGESKIERLNAKLLKARTKLESDTSAEEWTRGIVSSLSKALQQLQAEVEAVKDEKENASKEACDIKQEIEKTEMDIKCTQKKLLDNISELEKVKASEAAALVKLQSMVEKIVKSRVMDSWNASTISVPKWEYEYLSKKAGLAEEVAEKKVAAMNAWIETLKAQEKEILMKSELVEKEIKAMRVTQEEEGDNLDNVMAAQITTGEDDDEFMDILKAGSSTPKKLVSENSITASRRWSKSSRVSGMQGMKSAARSPLFAIKKRKGEKPTLGKLFRSRNGRRKQNEMDFDS
ncbi:protein PLASTID MOVEMENT IMPAIRED 2 isoform X2 [Phalaenopsis equestris]|uniref:protein PLASTID MOVEMENT IMPAIRED 2 isoform X2 n=1 Tax=Phalaenopsis equestris TaxID=78828 RepID=UPI0009E35FF8|nr:protein PLASTID MOVEMENT IMPAIRED 2 isoform X2 [Phalaenopsis equestris]